RPSWPGSSKRSAGPWSWHTRSKSQGSELSARASCRRPRAASFSVARRARPGWRTGSRRCIAGRAPSRALRRPRPPLPGQERGGRSTPGPDLWAEAALDDDWQPAPGTPASAPERIFLTGASGFLGAYLLHDLLEATPASVSCLVRAPNAAAGRRRIEDNLAAYGLWDANFAARLEPVPGDLARPRFGLDEEQFGRLAESVDAVYHNGAW